MRRTFGRMLFVVALAALPRSVTAQAFIEHVFPPVAQRGEPTRLRLIGSSLQGATALWTTLPDGTWRADPIGKNDEGEAFCDLHIAADAPLGLYGLRIATGDGLSNVHLFAVDQLAVVPEREFVTKGESANGRRGGAQAVPLPAIVAGGCGPSDIDHFAIDVKAGERLSFEVVGNRLGKGFDPVLTILDSAGEFVTDRDNDVGLFFDCRFGHTFERPGRYIVRIHDSRYRGSAHWTYLLRIGRFPIARVALPSSGPPGVLVPVSFPQQDRGAAQVLFPATGENQRFFFELRDAEDNAPAWLPLTVSTIPNALESEPNETADRPNEVSVPCNLHGMMNREDDRDFFSLELRKGQRLRITADTRNMGSAADLELKLRTPDGKIAKSIDDFGFEDAAFDFTAEADGRHLLEIVEVVGGGGPEYVYRIEIKERKPAIELVSEAGRLAIPQGTWQPAPIKLNRTDYAGRVDLSLAGAPDGVRLRNPTIPADATKWTGAIEVDPSVPPGVYSLRIEGDGGADKASVHAVARTQPLVDRLPTGTGPHGEPFELREDQRRLPPSLTDRLALLVLPPAPFDFELAASEVVLPRYGSADFRIDATRTDGFAGPVEFVARGGQLEQNRLQMPTVIATIPAATTEVKTVTGTLRSGVNTSVTRHRVTVTGTAKRKDRTISLTRTMELAVKVAFAPAADPARIELTPGVEAKIRIHANRLAPFTGAVTVALGESEMVEAPRTVVIPEGQSEVEVAVKVADGAKPGKYAISLNGTARVAKFFEEGKGTDLEIVVPQTAGGN